MEKLVFDRFYIEMNEQDIARIISDFLTSVSNGNIQLNSWKFEVVQSIGEHDVAFSYRLKKLSVKVIEERLRDLKININFVHTVPPDATDRYLVVYLPVY